MRSFQTEGVVSMCRSTVEALPGSPFSLPTSYTYRQRWLFSAPSAGRTADGFLGSVTGSAKPLSFPVTVGEVLGCIIPSEVYHLCLLMDPHLHFSWLRIREGQAPCSPRLSTRRRRCRQMIRLLQGRVASVGLTTRVRQAIGTCFWEKVPVWIEDTASLTQLDRNLPGKCNDLTLLWACCPDGPFSRDPEHRQA